MQRILPEGIGYTSGVLEIATTKIQIILKAVMAEGRIKFALKQKIVTIFAFTTLLSISET
jgi:hypothetical protein